MAAYLVRVELFGNATWHIYDQLHAAMERKGFAKTLTIHNGTVYDLPTATYYRETQADIASITNEAKRAADSVWRNNGLIATQAGAILVDGLKVHSSGRRFGYG
jgi:hypothetical protein